MDRSPGLGAVLGVCQPHLYPRDNGPSGIIGAREMVNEVFSGTNFFLTRKYHFSTLGNMDAMKRQEGFTLIELLMVIAIIGILAAVAIPFFQGYILRAKLTEVQNAISTVGSAVSAYHHDQDGDWPNCSSIEEIRNSLGVGLGNISRISGMSIVDGVITATVDNIAPLVDGKTLSLTPIDPGDGSIRWVWGASLDFPVHLRPKGD